MVVALVNILGRVRVVLGLLGSLVGFLLDAIELAVEVVDLILDDLLNNLCQNGNHDPEKQRLDDGEKSLVLGLLQLDVDVLDVDDNSVDLEEVRVVSLVSSLQGSLEAETASAQEDVHDTGVGDGWETLFLLDVVADVCKKLARVLPSIAPMVSHP